MRRSPRTLAQLALIQTFTVLVCVTIGPAYAGPTGTDIVATDEIPLLAVGPVSEIDTAAGTLTVNGQVFVVDSQTGVYLLEASSAGTEPAANDSPETLQAQDQVAIYGEMMDAGLGLATVISEIPEDYVAGSTTAYIRVEIGADDANTGVALSGDTVIDYTAVLAAADFPEVTSGDVLEFYGLAYGEHFYATEGYPTDLASDDDTDGSSALAIRGSGVRAIRGSGVRAIRGSGVR